MFRRVGYVAWILFLVQISHAVASDEVPAATQALSGSVAEAPQVEMEKCFGLPDARPKECAADPDSDECRESEERGKDGTEFKYVLRGTCVRQGGSSVMAKRPEPQT
jgi:uncharacterized membrane protein